MRLIAATDSNWGIGFEDKLQFFIRSDLKRFKELTTGGIVIYGRKTLMTFPGGRPLKDRKNLILSRQMDLHVENAGCCHNLPELFNELRKFLDEGYSEDQIYVIGGASVYQQLLPFCGMALITRVNAVRPADSYLPDLDNYKGWSLLETTEMMTEQEYQFQYRTYVNICPQPWLNR